jgi:starch synthase
MSTLKILNVSVEVAPYAKVGGLADVAASLPKALRALGHDARLALPAYGMVLDHPQAAPKLVCPKFPVKVNPRWTATARLHEFMNDGVPAWLLGAPGIFEACRHSEELYSPGRDAYIFLAKGILAACELAGWIPDVIHCNDWHTGFLPVLLRELGGRTWSKTASVFTIHNLQYMGEFGPDALDAAGLPQSLFNMHQLETFGLVNFLKSGCVYADQVNTVSPSYAQEIQTGEEYGHKLWGLMRDLEGLGRLRGILNGIDTELFDPASDPQAAQNYSAEDLSGKAACKAALQAELRLPEFAKMPLVAMVTRLSDQKGFDSLFRQAYAMLALPVQFVVLAVGDPRAVGELRLLEHEWPESVRFVERFDVELANRIFAAADLFLMPSNFEPCGLGQMIAMRYGAVPVVRRTGGLADTVFDRENGIVYERKSPRELFEAIRRAVGCYYAGEPYRVLQRAGMTTDFSWARSALEYVRMYQDAIAARRAKAMVEQRK